MAGQSSPAVLRPAVIGRLFHRKTLIANVESPQRPPRCIKAETAAEGDWTDHEVLAHIAVLSKFYGVMVHKISSGQLTEVDMLANTNLRDVAGEQLAAMAPADLLQMIRADHARTVKLLRSVDAPSLRRGARLPSGETVTAEFLARYPLINHLEEHVEQLEAHRRKP